MVAAVAVGVAVTAVPAQAVPGETGTGTTEANVAVESAITLTDLTAAFTLTGIPGDAPTAAVTMVVTTNNAAGYTVTVESQTSTLDPAIVANTDTIPIGSLEVRGSETGAAFVPVTAGTPTLLYTKTAPSVEAGDPLSNTYRMEIPFVEPDTYSATLDYVATTL